MGCGHPIVLEIYSNSKHTDIEYYRCVKCWKKSKKQFGIKIISELKHDILNKLK